MAGKVVDRLLVGIRYVSDGPSAQRAMRLYGGISVGIAAASAAVGAFLLQQTSALDETAKTARSLDLTTEAYTRLAYAADLSGVTQDKLKASLRSLTVQIGGVAQGSKEASANFAKIGVDVRNADGSFRTAAELLPEVADGLQRLDKGQRAAFRSRLLGESGGDLASLLQAGSEGIHAMEAEADALGMTLSSDTAQAAEALTDNLTRLKGLIGGAAMQIAGLLIPAAVDMTDGLIDMTMASDGLFRVGLDRTLRIIRWGLDALKTPTGKAAAGIFGVSGAFGAIKAGGAVLSPVLSALGISFGGLTTAAAPWLLVAAGIALVLEDIWVTAQGGDSIIRRVADAFGVGEETAAYLRDTLLMLGKAWEAATILGGELAALLPEWGTAIVDYAKTWSGVASAVGDLAYAFANVVTMGGLEILWQYFDRDPWKTPLGRFLSWIASAFKPGAALSGFGKLIQYATGGNVGVTKRAGVLAAPMVGLAESARARKAEGAIERSDYQRRNAWRVGTRTPSTDIQVQVQVDSTDTRRAAYEAGRDTEREILRATAAVGAH